MVRGLTDTYRQAQALTALATVLAGTGNTIDAERLSGEAERVARSLVDTYLQSLALTALATALAKEGNTSDAERVARSITDTDRQAQALTALATVLAETGNTTDAERLGCEILFGPAWVDAVRLLVSLAESCASIRSSWLTRLAATM